MPGQGDPAGAALGAACGYVGLWKQLRVRWAPPGPCLACPSSGCFPIQSPAPPRPTPGPGLYWV